jgi:hypothetical protein
MIQSTPMLGESPKEDDRRDAIHIAIVPVVAACNLNRGDHVGLFSNGTASWDVKEKIGIVDPFLKEYVKKGETFWLCLYPYSITSLRHVWTHPAFKATIPAK